AVAVDDQQQAAGELEALREARAQQLQAAGDEAVVGVQDRQPVVARRGGELVEAARGAAVALAGAGQDADPAVTGREPRDHVLRAVARAVVDQQQLAHQRRAQRRGGGLRQVGRVVVAGDQDREHRPRLAYGCRRARSARHARASSGWRLAQARSRETRAAGGVSENSPTTSLRPKAWPVSSTWITRFTLRRSSSSIR